MEKGSHSKSYLFNRLDIDSFYQRFPWIGGDLQTLRDTFILENLPRDIGEKIYIPVPEIPCGSAGSGHLLALLDKPYTSEVRGVVLMLHGLGGSSRRQGLRRMAWSLVESGFAVLRLNLRGADPGRELAEGTYSAKCNSDLIPVINVARQICNQLTSSCKSNKPPLPLFGVGISLGGTILLNACLDKYNSFSLSESVFDGLVCVSSPLDLALCSASIERPRNWVYQQWLLHRLVRQTLADPFGVRDHEKKKLLTFNGKKSRDISSIRSFDEAITAPRWGYKNVDDYYYNASPLNALLNRLDGFPPSLFIQSIDDPWVPAKSAITLANVISSSQLINNLEVILTSHGGHNGFHGKKGCWGDCLVTKWIFNQTS